MNDSAYLYIEGFAERIIDLNQTYTVVNNTLSTVGFAVTNQYVYDANEAIDIYVSAPNDAFAAWDLKTQLGPISSNWIIQWGNANLGTPLGSFSFDDDASVSGSFQAVPIPSAGWLIAGALGAVAPRLRRRQATAQ